VSSVF